MKVTLAGYNVDREILDEMVALTGPRDDLTPETFSASYARISRDGRPIDEIRREARKEVERTRKSNQAIIFKMGHHSVAEHAVFNFDVLDVSRYVMEVIEHFRLCSYTEKSQRYITLTGGHMIPEEIKGSSDETLFCDMVAKQNVAYEELFAVLRDYVFTINKELAANPKMHPMLEGWAKEDARYITPLCTHAQVGMTVNARNLELMLRRFASHPLKEVQAVRLALYEAVKNIAPSILMFHEANSFDQQTYAGLTSYAQTLFPDKEKGLDSAYDEIQLVHAPHDGDERLLAALLHTATQVSYADCLIKAQSMKPEEKETVIKKAFCHMEFFDTVVREFEYIDLTFDSVLSAACFGQLKRHRMATITSQDYDPSLGVTIPEAIRAAGLEKRFCAIIDQTNDVYATIAKEHPQAAPYVLTNAHRKRVLVKMNARELYHTSRLREDNTAQWDIRKRVQAMSALAKEIMPLTFMMIGGKDRYKALYQGIFGAEPKIPVPVHPKSVLDE